MTTIGNLPLGLAGGVGFQLFTQSDNNPGIYADAAARDVYFGANPSELARLDANEYLIIKLLDNGSGEVAYQQRASSAWVDVTSLVQGEQGPAGATGNSYFFASIADRDTFFNTPPNEGLLENGLPVTVNIGDDTTSQFIWGGDTSPPSYDADLWRLSAAEVASGTLFLGTSGSNISSGNEVLNYNTASGNKTYTSLIEFDDTGSSQPRFWELAALSQIPLADVLDTTLADPQAITTTNTINVYVKEYTLIPAASGELRVQTWIGSDETGPNIVDTFVTVDPGDVGKQTVFTAPNPTLVLIGEQTYTKFSGLQLQGGLQTSGPFVGQTAPFMTLWAWLSTSRDFVTQNEDVLNLQCPDGSTDAEINFFDSTPTLQANIAYNPSLADLITTTSSGIAYYVTSGGTVTIEANDVLSIAALGDDQVTIQNDESIFVVNSSTGGYSFSFSNTEPNTEPLFVWAKDDVTGGVTRVYLTNTTPEGVITADGGSLCFLDDDANSNIFLKLVNATNTSWQSLLGDIIGPDSSSDNGIPTWDGTTGKLQKSLSTARIIDDGTDIDLEITVPTANGTAAIEIQNSSNASRFEMLYNELVNVSTLISKSGNMFVSADTGDINIVVAGAAQSIYLTGSASPDTNPLLSLTTGGTNGGGSNVYLGSRDPEGTITGDGGDFYIRDANTNSAPYFKLSDGTNTGWRSLLGNVVGPTSSVDNAVAVFDGTSGELLKSSGLFTYSDAVDSRLNLKSSGLNDGVQVQLESSASTYTTLFRQDELGGVASTNILLTGSNHDFDLTATGSIELETSPSFPIALTNTGATYTLNASGQNHFHQFVNTQPNTNPIARFQQTGTNGGVFDFFASTVSPEGVIDSGGGSLCVVSAGTSSDLFIKRTVSGNTGWLDFLHSGNGVQGPATSKDNGVVTWDGTDGSTVQSLSQITYTETTFPELKLKSPGVNDGAQLLFESSAGTYLTLLKIDEIGGVGETDLTLTGASHNFELNTSGGIELQSNVAFPILLTNTGATYTLNSSGQNHYHHITNTEPVTNPLLRLSQTGTNGGISNFHISTLPPNGLITTAGGGVCIVPAGVSSEIYLKRIETGNSGWVALLHEDNGVQGPATSTDNAIATWDGTDGLTIQNTQAFAVTGANSTVITVENVTATGQSGFQIRNSSSITRYSVTYNQNTNDVFETTNSGASYTWLIDGTIQQESLSNIAIGSLADETVELYNTTANFRVDDTANGSRLFFTNNTADTAEMIFMNKTGTNGGGSEIYLTSRTPEGNLPASGGAVAIRDDGTDSELYLKKTEAAATGWATLLHTTATSSTANALAVFDTTSGSSINEVPTITASLGATDSELRIKPVTALGTTSIAATNFAGTTTKLDWYYDEPSDLTEIASNASGFTIRNFNGPLTFKTLSWENNYHVRNVSPVGLTTGDPGDIAIANVTDPAMYIHEGAAANNTDWKKVVTEGNRIATRSYPVTSISSGSYYYGGYYQAPATDVTLTIGGTVTQTLGTANVAYGAHAFCVASGPGGTDLVLTVSGTSTTDLGVLTPGDSEIIVADTDQAATDQYLETSKKWVSQITYTLTGAAGSFTFNYGFAKYEDFGNTDFVLGDVIFEGLAAANESDLNYELLKHQATGWTYAATGFVPGSTAIVSLGTDYSTNDQLLSGDYFAYKRVNLATAVSGSGSEGILSRITTTSNNVIQNASVNISVTN